MEAEVRSISNRHDLSEHLNKLRQNGVISEFVETGKRDFAEKYSSTIDYSKFIKGATFVSLENSMILQEEMSNNHIQASLGHQPANRQVTFYVKKYWPICLYPYQNTSIHGVIFPKIPKFKSKHSDTRNIWTLASILSRVESLWKIDYNGPFSTSK